MLVVHGGWSRWSQWSACDKPCGGGKQKRERECNNPTPRFGGNDCPGLTNRNRQLRLCNTQACSGKGHEVNSGWVTPNIV